MEAAALSSDFLELRIKTLDAQEFSVQVGRNASIPELKERVAASGGCPIESQRLIYKGRVLKDEQRVTDYGIESGHVIHLVARQPPPPNDGDDDDEMPELEDLGPQVMSSISIDGAEGIPNLNNVLSAVLGSLGLAGGMPIPVPQPTVSGVQVQHAGGVETQTIEMHFDFPPMMYQAGQGGLQPARAAPLRAASQGGQRRGDSLATMSNFLRHLERRMQAHNDVLRQHGTSPAVRGGGASSAPPPPAVAATGAAGTSAPSPSDASTGTGAAAGAPSNSAPAPRVPPAPAASAAGAPGGEQGQGDAAIAPSRPALLSGLLGRTQALLRDQADPMLTNVHGRLANEAAMTDPGERGTAQADMHIAGSLLQALGALLLELGRATRSVNLNTQPSQAIVNPAPATFVSNSGVLSSLYSGQPPAGAALPPSPQAQAPGNVVLQLQPTAPVIQVPGMPSQVVLQMGARQTAVPRGMAFQVGEQQQFGGQMIGPNGGVMMQLLPNGMLAPIQGPNPPPGSIFAGTIPASNVTPANLQQAYAGAQAQQPDQQQAYAGAQAQQPNQQQLQDFMTRLFTPFMNAAQAPPGAQPTNMGANAQATNPGVNSQPRQGPANVGAQARPTQRTATRDGGVNRTQGTDPLQTAQTAGHGQQRTPVQQAPPSVSISGPIDGNALMNMMGPILQQLAGGQVNMSNVVGGAGVQPGQEQAEAGTRQQNAPPTQQSPFRFPAPAVQPAPGATQQPPAVRSFTVTRNIPVPGGNVRATTTTLAVQTIPQGGGASQQPGGRQQPSATEPSGGVQASQQPGGGQQPAGNTSALRPSGGAVPSTSQQGGESASDGQKASGGATQEPATNEGGVAKKDEKPAAEGGSTAGGEGASASQSGPPAGLGGAGLQPLLPRSRRRAAPRPSEQQGRDSLNALSQVLQGAGSAGQSNPPQGGPALGNIMGSVMQAMGGQGGAGGLSGMIGQLMSNPGVDQMMRQVEDGGGAPDIGSMMSQMMPMVAQMLGGGGSARPGGVRARPAQEGEQGWQEALSEEERARWEATIARDGEAQAAAGPQRPLSEAYLRGSPAKRQRTGLDGAAFLMQNADSPEAVLDAVARTVGSEELSGNAGLAEAYVSTLVDDVTERAASDPDFGDGGRFPNTKEAVDKKQKEGEDAKR